ncbi:MAG: hypothetical protein HETSPECPRED_007063 [Heterodermia speciosa]|uniref:WIBG Mago-binding domain-containing protein n=1 Tax=Heterodermia speciosa TaxID=116794 RepID=A0A8H3EKE5_9LECA|nr:MAG: hypothetical protein HETSPECPRED_007063 [Heterodermia speciosa]
MPSVSTNGTSSGITTSATGDRHIPASVRADGSTRKEIKIRPGYKPPEDVEVYKNPTAEAWKSRGAGGVPGATSIIEPDIESKLSNTKNAKRREARRKAKAAEEGAQIEAVVGTGTMNGQPSDAASSLKQSADERGQWRKEDLAVEATEDPLPLDLEAEKEKKVRNLRKKLRQARDLSAKKDKGENLLPEQFEKVIKMNELIRQLDALGFDMDGEPR